MSAADDELTRRLRAADPAPSDRAELPSGRRIEDLVEETMNLATEHVEQAPARNAGARRWLAAAAVLAVAGAGVATYEVTSGGNHSRPTSSVSLTLPAGPAQHPGPPGTTCIRFTIDHLAQQDVAFSGTVTSLGDHVVRLAVDHWYKGGSASEVDLTTTGTPGAVNELGVTFSNGTRYLVSATAGTVTGCGYTGEYSSDLASAFQQAFHG